MLLCQNNQLGTIKQFVLGTIDVRVELDIFRANMPKGELKYISGSVVRLRKSSLSIQECSRNYFVRTGLAVESKLNQEFAKYDENYMSPEVEHGLKGSENKNYKENGQ